MSRTTPGIFAGGLLAVALSMLVATAIGASGAEGGGTRTGGTQVAGTTSIRNTRVTTFNARRFWWHGGWQSLIGTRLLTGFAIGRVSYYPDSYVALAQSACSGFTESGCSLRWQSVSTDRGASIPHCVQFCPRNGSAAPVAAAPAAVASRQGCEVEIFHGQNLSGQSVKTSEDQPVLNEWEKQISSIHVISGTWDFASEQQYGGDALRLSPGTYQDLANWDKQISSFMCVQNASFAAPAAAAPAGAGPGQHCEVEVFHEQNLSGQSAKTTEDQPVLNEWDKQISSIHVISGTWDFASEQQYRGETVRLSPGTYRDLAQWNKQISSFMCVR